MLFAVSALALPTHNTGALALTANCLTALCLAASAQTGIAATGAALLPPSELMPSGSLSEQIQVPCFSKHGALPLLPGIEEFDRDRLNGLNLESASFRAANSLKKFYRFPSRSSLPELEASQFSPTTPVTSPPCPPPRNGEGGNYSPFPPPPTPSHTEGGNYSPFPPPPTPSHTEGGNYSPFPTREGGWGVRFFQTKTIAADNIIAENSTADSAPAGKPPSLRLVPESDYQAPPSISVGVPFAYGLSLGSVGIGLGLQERTRYTSAADGGMGISIGLGNPQKFVGFDVGVSIFDLSDFGSRGSISFKLHRAIATDFEVAVGWQNAIVWGSTDAGTSFYGVLTKTFRLRDSVSEPFSLLVVSAGMGSGQFRSEADIYSDRESVGVFGSAALRVAKPLNAIAEWTGQDMTLGLSWVPFPKTPLVLTGGVTDLTGNAGDGSRLIFRVGYILSF